jgi:hypothetical protein
LRKTPVGFFSANYFEISFRHAAVRGASPRRIDSALSLRVNGSTASLEKHMIRIGQYRRSQWNSTCIGKIWRITVG